MSSRKEEERNEKVIRGLMKLPPNRRCINCNSLGPQYVCTNFWTFVCMTCSGIHREFTHRVKSVSMSKFTSQEVEALQEGGNQRARETFLKDWDPREQRLPDNSNVDKVRDFIKTVYVDKKFFSSKPSGKPPRDTLNNRNHDDETRRASSYHSYSQSPPYDYQYEERRYGKQPPALTKKPGSDRGMFRFLSASRLNDHVQEDTFANEVSNARVSDFSVNNGGDLFRSGTQTPPNLSNSSGSGKFDGLDLFSAPNAPQSEPEPEPQKFGGLDLFNAPNAPVDPKNFDDLDLFNAPNAHVEPKKFDDLDLFNAPNAPVEPKKFDDLDLFNAPNAPVEPKKFDDLDLFTAPNAPKSTTLVDLFDFSGNTSSSSGVGPPNVSVSQQFKAFEPSLELDLFTGMSLPHQQLVTETIKDKSINTVSQENDGWATFDMPWQAHAQSSQQDFSAIHSPWVDPVNEKNNQSWSSFEESTTPFETICTKSSEQVPVIADLWGTSEMNQADSDTKDVAQSHGSDAKSRNPFDFPSDTDLESTDMFLDMSSLQSALPNHNISTSWFPESAAIPYNSQDSLLFMAGQPPTMNIQAQGPVASIGGNPFG